MARPHDPASKLHARPSSEGVGVPPDDWLSDVLHTVRLSGAVFFLWEAGWPFAMPVSDGTTFAELVLPGAQTMVSFHVVLDGTCFAAADGVPPFALHPGDVLLVPQGVPYAMSDRAETCTVATSPEASRTFFAAMADGTLPSVIRDGAGPPRTDVVCGFLGCDLHPFNPVLGALPALVRIPAGVTGPLRPWVERAVAESRTPRPGGKQALHRLSEWLFVEILRCCIVDLDHAEGWLAALRDPTVGQALRCLHRVPQAPWTLARLAKRCGASRSQLAKAFASRVGQPPMQYLTHWRIQLAARLLTDGDAKVEGVAREVGYRSPAAFSRAFKRLVGQSPATWRARAIRGSARKR